MQHRLTDFDLAVLAAARIGMLEPYRKNAYNSAAKTFWRMNGVDVSRSLARLVQAGEIHVAQNGKFMFLDSSEYRDHERVREIIKELRRKIRSGEIKLPKLKKGE